MATNFHSNILDTIAQTPLVQLSRLGTAFQLFAKLEAFNPGGSIKDRTALQLIRHAITHFGLKKGDTVVESSSGNMAIGLAQACKFFGMKLQVVVDPMVNQQTLKILKAYGAGISQVTRPAEEGGFLQARLDRVQELLEENPRSFWPNQYGNPQNPAAHVQTMREITRDLGQAPDYLFAATSTCGTLMGCAEYIRTNQLRTKVIGVDAAGSAIFSSAPRERKIPGHGAGRKSQFLKEELVHDVVHVDDQECVIGCHRLMDAEAMLCGGSSGAVISALEKYSDKIPRNSKVAIILCDRGERYLDTIYNEEWVKENILESCYEVA
ncbi:2,3-diaminopropionate biosynthesis protein SbnA [Algoriphagus halophytocola]|uniref:N-(2-amino-2-carboxyethyl)-L-glutamate synthase n=1 Tax=Algoriphagus halophytocola TaxID=2991499 RepID=A0ABY6MMZ3_9BACT|nr:MULTISPECIES: 2,3-diaminopropionate biosynthesis protein SbnA [unclassified Algoriphagus]UZD23574.1 2,3-diaminopropionate biosynthesis protein SbnA [Algoriphagus sp. TR-M5]WBL44868.1 2,3-diaminopropionate biosynthesis protein SbnA [Algoriphagus sp. TR-M9]